jgi:hypothetical protein
MSPAQSRNVERNRPCVDAALELTQARAGSGHQLSPRGSFAMARRSMISMHRAQINSPSPAGGARTVSSSGAKSSSQ